VIQINTTAGNVGTWQKLFSKGTWCTKWKATTRELCIN
jgi:hypothetical protein